MVTLKHPIRIDSFITDNGKQNDSLTKMVTMEAFRHGL